MGRASGGAEEQGVLGGVRADVREPVHAPEDEGGDDEGDPEDEPEGPDGGGVGGGEGVGVVGDVGAVVGEEELLRACGVAREAVHVHQAVRGKKRECE